MPKYTITIKKSYDVEVEARTVEEAKRAGWEKHMTMLAKGEDFPKMLHIDHKRVREEVVTLTSNQKKRLERKLKEINEAKAVEEENARQESSTDGASTERDGSSV